MVKWSMGGMVMRITELINNYLVNPHTIDKRARFSHYPSEASIISRLNGKVMGKCHRASWYSWLDMPVTNPLDARAYWTFEMGKKIEASYIEYCKQLGIWAGNNVKFYDREHNISGEADLFVFDGGKTEGKPDILGIEIKSAYGYGYKKKVTQFPKIENLLQVALYMDYFHCDWNLVYKARDTQEDVEYRIVMKTETNGDKILIINGITPVLIFYMQDIYDRYNTLGEYIIEKKMPPRDYTYGYSLQESEERCKAGEITKSRLNNIKAEKIMDSDWQCVYCSYLDECWKEKRNALKMKGGLNGNDA